MNCILSGVCRAYQSAECNALCGAYIGVHGSNGLGGRIGSARVPADYRMLTIGNSPVTAADISVRIGASDVKLNAILRDYAATFGRQFEREVSGGPPRRIKSLYLVSDSPGTGKTTTAAALLNEYVIAAYVGAIQRGRQPLERPAYFVDLNGLQTLFNRIHLSVGDDARKDVSDEFQRQLDAAARTPFVVIDDVGVRSASEAFRAYVHDVINARVTNGLPTIYTSNVRIMELAQVFDARLADRVRDMTVEITFTGGSKRGMR